MTINPHIYYLSLILLTLITGGFFFFTRSSMLRILLTFVLIIFVLLPVRFSEGPLYFLFLLPLLLSTSSLVFKKNIKPIPIPERTTRISLFILYIASLMLTGFLLITMRVNLAQNRDIIPVFSVILLVVLVLVIRLYLNKDKGIKK